MRNAIMVICISTVPRGWCLSKMWENDIFVPVGHMPYLTLANIHPFSTLVTSPHVRRTISNFFCGHSHCLRNSLSHQENVRSWNCGLC
jgi:hypothetical protein